jgi:hypothetical protein
MRVEFNLKVVIYDALLYNLYIWARSRPDLSQI